MIIMSCEYSVLHAFEPNLLIKDGYCCSLGEILELGVMLLNLNPVAPIVKEYDERLFIQAFVHVSRQSPSAE